MNLVVRSDFKSLILKCELIQDLNILAPHYKINFSEGSLLKVKEEIKKTSKEGVPLTLKLVIPTNDKNIALSVHHILPSMDAQFFKVIHHLKIHLHSKELSSRLKNILRGHNLIIPITIYNSVPSF